MCRTAGFEGFTDLKLALARDPGSVSPQPADTPPADGLQAARGVFMANRQALSDTLSVLDQTTFNRALDLLAGARHILAGGVGGSGIVAQAFYQRCFRLGLRCDAPVDSQLQ